MACQGCGRTDSTKNLCCPTCIELGRKSFFCSQDCFHRNWKVHSQLHDLLRKKSNLASGGVGPNSEAPAETAAPSISVSSAPAPTRRSLAPLPGGTPLAGYLDKRSATNGVAFPAAAEKPGSAARGAWSQMWQLITAAAPAAAPAGKGAASGPPDARRVSSSTAAASPRSASSASKGSLWGTMTRRFAMNSCVWALAVSTMLASGALLRAHLRYEQENQAVIVPAAPSDDVADVASSLLGSTAVAASSMLGGTGGAGAAEMPAIAATAPPVPGGTLAALRAELQQLRELTDRHDKMLRYIMDRYLEKGLSVAPSAIAAGGRSTETHEASAVNFSAPEFVSKSYAVDESMVKAGDGVRKRRGGDAEDGTVGVMS